MNELDIQTIYEFDKGTLSTSSQRRVLKELQARGSAFIPYAQRVGPGFATAASEVKRVLDGSVVPAFQAVLGRITHQRFERAYGDVRLYPQGQEWMPWDGGTWADARLSVLVSFVLSIPSDDSLDSMARASLLSMFEESSWDPEVKKLGKKAKLRELLNVDTLNSILSDLAFEHFNPFDLDGFELEIMIDGCPAARFDRLADLARGVAIQKARSARAAYKGDPPVITADNADTTVPVLIAAIARELGVRRLDPATLQAGDSLYALMGFDENLTLSLTHSISGHFDVLSVIGGLRMVTVGNAIEFARETLQSRDDD